MSDTVDLKLTPDIDVTKAQAQLHELLKSAEDVQRALLNLGPEIAKVTNATTPLDTPGAIQRALRNQFVKVSRDRGPVSFSDIQQQIKNDPNVPEPIRQGVDLLTERSRLDQERPKVNAHLREARAREAAYRKTPEGIAKGYRAGIYRSADREVIQEEELESFYNSEQGQKVYKTRADNSELHAQRSALARKLARPAARRRAYQEAGLKLPEDIKDMNPFAKALQDTFKSAASLGMLEAMSGGNAAPLARAFAGNIIAGALLPSALNGFAALGKAGGGLLGNIFSRGGSSAASSAEGGVVNAGEQAAGGLMGGLGAVAGPAAAIVGLTALLAGGAALFMSSKSAEYNTIQEQMAAAVGGNANKGNDSAFLDQLSGSSRKFYYAPDTMAAVGVSLGGMGVQQGQSLRSNIDNTAMLARLTGTKDPNAFSSLVGSMATSGGMSADDITKMIGLLMKQNDLTAANGVPLNTMVGNLQTLVSLSGGTPVNATSVAGIAAISHLAASMGAAGKHLAGNIGQIVAPMMGATGMNAMMAESILGVSPEDYQKMKTDPAALVAGSARFVQRATSGVNDPTLRLQNVEALLQTMPLLGGSQLGAADQETFAKLLLSIKGNGLQGQAMGILGQTPTDANAVKQAVALIAKGQTSAVDQATLAWQQSMVGYSRDSATYLNQLVQIMGRTMNQANPGALSPAAQAYQTQHGGAPSMVNGQLMNPDGTPYKGPPIGGGAPGMPTGSAYIPGKGMNIVNQKQVSGWNLGTSHQMVIPAQYAQLINAAAKTYGLDPRLIASVMRDESGFNQNAVSGAGAIGLMQLMPQTFQGIMAAAAKQKGNPLNTMSGNISDPATNIFAGAEYLKQIQESGVSPTDYYTQGLKYNAGIGTSDAYAAAHPNVYGQSMQEGQNVQNWTPTLQSANIGLTGTLTLVGPTGKILGTGTIQAQGSHS